MSRTTSLAWQSTLGGYVGALCDGAPEDVALDSLAMWAQGRAQRVRGFVIEDLRGGLDAARSRCLKRLSEALDAPIAVLTDSALVRGFAACHLLGPRVYAFSRRDCQGALDALAVPAGEREALRAALRALRVAHKLTRNARRRSKRESSSAA